MEHKVSGLVFQHFISSFALCLSVVMETLMAQRELELEMKFLQRPKPKLFLI